MTTKDQHLLQLFSQLSREDRQTLLAFAEFLSGRTVDVSEPAVVKPDAVAEPEPIERPTHETIVAGLKRLSKTYPMLDKSEMLKATSDLVANNVMQGGDPREAINELERVFRAHYDQYKAEKGK